MPRKHSGNLAKPNATGEGYQANQFVSSVGTPNASSRSASSTRTLEKARAEAKVSDHDENNSAQVGNALRSSTDNKPSFSKPTSRTRKGRVAAESPQEKGLDAKAETHQDQMARNLVAITVEAPTISSRIGPRREAEKEGHHHHPPCLIR